MRGRKISGSAIVGAICLMLLAVMDIIRIFRFYVPYMIPGLMVQAVIQGIGAIGVIVIAIGRLAKAKTVMLVGSVAYMLCEVIYTYNSLSGLAGSDGFYGVMNLFVNIFCLAAAVVLFIFILKFEKLKSMKYIWYIPAGCALISGIFMVGMYGTAILHSPFAYKMSLILPILFRIAGMLFIGLDLMKLSADKKTVPNMNGVPNTAYANNQVRAYQRQPYRAPQQGNPQMQYQQMPGNAQQRYQQMPNNAVQYQQTQNNPQTQYPQMPNNPQAQYRQTANHAQMQYQQMSNSTQTQYQQTSNTNQNQQTQANTQSSEQVLTLAEELKKYKELVDAGIITEQEYEEKKKKLLGL